MIGIIDYGMGNLRSVQNAFDYVGADVMILQESSQFEDCTHLVLPGVGAYEAAMTSLREYGFDQLILKKVAEGVPLLGVCLGMQMLSDVGYEFNRTQGLGLIPGEVVKIPTELRLPHVGWNNIAIVRPHPVLEGIKPDRDFYFVHSYHFSSDPKYAITTTDYGITLNSIVGKNNVIGIQFHPEKSQSNGLQILENFSQWDGQC